MAMWDVDLTTRMGAETATRMGSNAAFMFAGLGVLGAVLYGFVLIKTNPAVATGSAIGGLFEAVIGIIAGLRLRGGKGLVWGGVAAVLLLLEEILKLVQLQLGGGIAIGIVVLVYLVNGLRGANALRQNRFADDDADVFA
jgi:hypothetical protein